MVTLLRYSAICCLKRWVQSIVRHWFLVSNFAIKHVLIHKTNTIDLFTTRINFMVYGDLVNYMFCQWPHTVSISLWYQISSSLSAREMLTPLFLNGALSKALKSSTHTDEKLAENLSFAFKYPPGLTPPAGRMGVVPSHQTLYGKNHYCRWSLRKEIVYEIQ